MYVLDTDHLSIADQDTIEGFNLGRRLEAVSPDQIVVSIVTYEEQMRGWLACLASANTIEKQIEGYARLRRHVELYRNIPILDFDRPAADEFERLRAARVRVKAMDMKIASIALAHDAILLTRNLSDFLKVPGLRAEDWCR